MSAVGHCAIVTTIAVNRFTYGCENLRPVPRKPYSFNDLFVLVKFQTPRHFYILSVFSQCCEVLMLQVI